MESDNKLLIRIDERQKAMADTIGKIEKTYHQQSMTIKELTEKFKDYVTVER